MHHAAVPHAQEVVKIPLAAAAAQTLAALRIASNLFIMANSTSLLIYGAYGYTGRLVVGEALAAGLRPILAGRDPGALAAMAAQHGLDHSVASPSDPGALDAALEGVGVVLNCAGPFIHTALPMVDACLRLGVHYLDITGELTVFEALAARDAEARIAGVSLLPGVGFDVVPSDRLAAHLAGAVASARRVLAGGISTGFQTPSRAFGADFILEQEATRREDVV